MLVQFISVVAPWHCRLPMFAEACLAALLSTFLFGVLDAVGLKMLWWTWHNSEQMYVERFLGVPLVSAIWIMASTGSLALVVRAIVDRPFFTKILPWPLLLAFGALAGPFATLGLMNIPMMLVYHPFVTLFGYPSIWVLTFFRICSLLVVLKAIFTARKRSVSYSGTIFFISLAYISILFGIALFGHPETVRRTSYSQPFGPCNVTESSFWGAFTRFKYVCLDTVVPERDHYSFDCIQSTSLGLPEPGADWYTVCGIPATDSWWKNVAFYFASAYAVVLLSQIQISKEGEKLKRL